MRRHRHCLVWQEQLDRAPPAARAGRGTPPPL